MTPRVAEQTHSRAVNCLPVCLPGCLPAAGRHIHNLISVAERERGGEEEKKKELPVLNTNFFLSLHLLHFSSAANKNKILLCVCLADVCVCVYANKRARERERAPELVLVRFICFALYTLFRPLKNPKHNSNLLCTLCLSIACLADFARCMCV